jgi:hypothetical protein
MKASWICFCMYLSPEFTTAAGKATAMKVDDVQGHSCKLLEHLSGDILVMNWHAGSRLKVYQKSLEFGR